jgi:hypothetical protein
MTDRATATVLAAAPSSPFGQHIWQAAFWVVPLAALANIALLFWALPDRPSHFTISAPWWLVAAFATILVIWAIDIVRLLLWSRFLGTVISLVAATRVTVGVTALNAVTPSSTGGPPIKLLLLRREGVSSARASGLIALQVAEDSMVLLPFCALALFWTGWALYPAAQLLDGGAAAVRIATIVASLIVLVTGAWGAIAAARRGLFGEFLRRKLLAWGEWFAALRRDMGADWHRVRHGGKHILALSMTMALVQWLTRFSTATMVIYAFGLTIDPLLSWLLLWLVMAVGSMVPTPGGAGGAEGAFLLIFSGFVASGYLVPVMVLWRLAFFFAPVALAALLFFLLRPRSTRSALAA